MIIDMGDFCSFNSLSHWDRDKKLKMEGRRYSRDCEAAQAAYAEMFHDINLIKDKQRHNKVKQYNPRRVKLIGNHEEWALRYLETHPEMEGFIDLDENLSLSHHFDTIVPYRDRFTVGGVTFCHAPMAQNNQPMSGKYVAHRAWDRHSKGIVFAHTHRLQVACDKRIDITEPSTSATIGCYIDPDDPPEYTVGSESGWWYGVVVVKIYNYGQFDIEPISMKRLKHNLY
jgi:hypothetical protein